MPSRICRWSRKEKRGGGGKVRWRKAAAGRGLGGCLNIIDFFTTATWCYDKEDELAFGRRPNKEPKYSSKQINHLRGKGVLKS
jgi:hypothetical protein